MASKNRANCRNFRRQRVGKVACNPTAWPSRAADNRGAWLRFPLKASKSALFAFCGSLEECLAAGDFELDQSARLGQVRTGQLMRS
jgi:hypothetical protein